MIQRIETWVRKRVERRVRAKTAPALQALDRLDEQLQRAEELLACPKSR